MIQTVLSLFLIAYLPGAVIYRLPFAQRARRAALPAEERAFWAIIISVALSSTLALGLAALGQYTFGRLLAGEAALSAVLVIAARGRLRLGPEAPRPGWTGVIPVLLIASSVWWSFAVPPAEYITGGRDPGVYMNAGIQIAQRRSLVTADVMVRSIPEEARSIFLPSDPGLFTRRFMGFFVTDQDAGTVVGQFPHGYPIWIAIGYGLDGLSGARRVVSWWAILGMLATYFAGMRLVGRAAATAGAALLSMHVVQVWYSHYPNSEIITQALLFSALLAHAYAHEDEDSFFGPIAASLLGLALFTRMPAVLAVAAAVIASVFAHVNGRRMRTGFLLPLAAWLGVALFYYLSVLAPYFVRPVAYYNSLRPIHFALWGAAGIGALALLVASRRPHIARVTREALPLALIVIVVVTAAYAYFLREPAGRLAAHDAYGLRTFADFYLLPLGLALALIGYGLAVRRSFWRAPALVLTATAFAFFFFYKMRIFPEHFWMARRFVPMILPSTLLFVGAAAFFPLSRVFQARWASGRVLKIARVAAGVFVVALLAQDYGFASEPMRRYVEHAGIIPNLERLAGRFGDDDLVLIESKDDSASFVMALPLAYIYARNVIIVHRALPDRAILNDFLRWADERYRNIYYIGATNGGGSALASPAISFELIISDRVQIPELERPSDAYPREVLTKTIGFAIYRLTDTPRPVGPWSLDVGTDDEVDLALFHAKERLGGSELTFRWTRDESYVAVSGLRPETQEVILSLNDGGRPPGVPPARVSVYLDSQHLGDAEPSGGFRDYHFPIPAALAEDLAGRPEGIDLRIATNGWIPSDVLGNADDRVLGVMLDRVELR